MGGTGTTGLDIVWNYALHQNSSSSVRDDRHIITWPPVYDVTDQLYLVQQDVARLLATKAVSTSGVVILIATR